MKLAPITSVREIRHAHMFCGIGGGALGMAETIGETILLAEQGESFFLSTREIWAKPGALALAVDNDQAAFRIDGGAA